MSSLSRPGGTDQISKKISGVCASALGPPETCDDIVPVFRTGIVYSVFLHFHGWPELIIRISVEKTPHQDGFIISPREFQ